MVDFKWEVFKIVKSTIRALWILVDAILIAIILGFSWSLVAQLYILSVLNVLAIPLMLWIFPQPWWVNYILILVWIGVILQANNESKQDKEIKKAQ